MKSVYIKNFYKRQLSSLERIYQQIESFLNKNLLDPNLLFPLNLAIEELFVNMIKYNINNTNDILIKFEKQKNTIVITLTDFNVDPFDIRKKDPYDSNQSIEKRPIGGVGIHLVNKIMDEIQYQYDAKDRKSTITLTKDLRK
jgi:anti-sigma regulatory factor (Ser/Thr protein kinase)